MGAVLAIDVGESRVGLAKSDELGIIAGGYGTISRKNAEMEISAIVKKEQIDRIVIGMPYLPSGGLGSQSKDVLEFIESLKQEINVPISIENEVLTSIEAENRLKSMGVKNVAKGEIDEMAAIIILESYLGGDKNVAND